MDMYIRMYDELKRSEGDNPTIGIVLCSDTDEDEDVARYSVLHGNEQFSTLKVMRYANSMLIIKKNVQYTNMSIRTMFHILKLHLILRNGTD